MLNQFCYGELLTSLATLLATLRKGLPAPMALKQVSEDGDQLLQIEKIAEVRDLFSSRILSVRIHPDQPKSAVLFVEGKEKADAEDKQALIYWQGSSSIRLSDALFSSTDK